MGQITINLDDDTEKRLAAVAKRCGVSKSQWIVDLIKEKITIHWPDEIVALAGAWADLPTVEEIRSDKGKVVERDSCI